MPKSFYLIKRSHSASLTADGIAWRYRSQEGTVFFDVECKGDIGTLSESAGMGQFENIYAFDIDNEMSHTICDHAMLGNVVSSYLKLVPEVWVNVLYEKPRSSAMCVS